MRAPFLESHEEFEGVGAHELNPRYDHVDDPDGQFAPLDVGIIPDPTTTPALSRARSMLSFVAPSAVGELDGVDSAHYQDDGHPMDWDALRRVTRWHARKVSQSTRYVDPTWQRAIAEMLRVAFEQMLGYGWISSTTDPEEQAAWFVKCAGEALRVIGAMGDAEEAGLDVDRCVAWYEAVEEAKWRLFGVQAPCSHYTGVFVAGGTLFVDDRIRESRFGPRPVILAAYVSRAKMLNLPNVRAKGIHAWQFSSNGRAGCGIVGRFDCDEIQDEPAFDICCHGRPAVVETPPPIESIPTAPPAPPPATPITPDTYDPSEDDMAGNAPMVKMDKRYNEAFLVGAGTPVWLTGEDVGAARAAGVPVVDSEAHPSFEIVAARAGCTALTARA